MKLFYIDSHEGIYVVAAKTAEKALHYVNDHLGWGLYRAGEEDCTELARKRGILVADEPSGNGVLYRNVTLKEA